MAHRKSNANQCRVTALIAEAKAIIPRLSTPLYRSCLQIAVREAEAGEVAYLLEQLPSARARLAKQDAEAAERARAEDARIASMAARVDAKDVLREYQKLQRAQQNDYARWHGRRPDERTARKAHLSNRLDGRARRMSDLDAMYRVLTGSPIGGSS